MTALSLSRRSFVATLSAGGGLAIGFADGAQAAVTGVALASPEKSPPGEINAWVVVDPDDTVTIRLPHAEIGQGAATALPMIVAEELGCDWNKVKVEYASGTRNQRENGIYGNMATVGSRGTRGSLPSLQKAGANARARLVAAAAKRWNVVAAECDVADSKVIHGATGRTLTFGALAADAVKVKLTEEPRVKAPAEFKVIGQPYARLDTPLKVDGSALFAMDAKVPGMVVATVAMCPVPGGKLKSVDANAVMGRKGVIAVVPMADAVAVAADGYWLAKQALDALPIEWDFGADAGTDTAQFKKLYRDTLKGDGVTAEEKGKMTEAFATSKKTLEAVYEVPFLSHAAMEPLNATVHLQDDRLDCWVGTQNPMTALGLAAAASGLPQDKIFIHNHFVGGGFGRKSMNDELAHAIAVAKVVKRPVKLIWSREQDIQHDRFRPQAAISFKAALGADGMPVGLEIKTAVGSLLRSLGRDKVEKGVEPMAVEGLVDNPYSIPHQRVGCVLKNTHIPVSFWRSVGASQNAFAIESFIDELAYAAGKDPAQFRRSLITRPDFLGVLDMLIEKSDWGKPLPKGKGRGIAIHECYGSIVGQTAEVSVSDLGEVKVERIVAVVDCGHVVNPKIVESQIQGGAIWGLSAALFSEITVKDGRVAQANFNDFRIAGLSETPEIEVHFALSGGEKWGGIGEPGSAPTAPAICNAIFAATGRRIRSLPVRNLAAPRQA